MNDKKMSRVIVTGATGFIGKALCSRLIKEGYEVVALSRNVEKGRERLDSQVTVVRWDGQSSEGWLNYADDVYAIVNLAGDNIASGRWTEKKKKSILWSRMNAGKAVVEAVKLSQKKPKVIIQASAIGYYGSRSDEIIDESSSAGKGFLADVVKNWEVSTREVESHKVRHVIIRSGVVLGRRGGVLRRFVKPFRFFIGGPIGSGKQWFSWIHLEDEVAAILFLMGRENLQGVFNLAAPHPLLQKDLSRNLGKVMRRPSWFPVPVFLLRLFFGEMADEMLLSSQRVVPKRLLEAGYRFQYPEIELSLRNLLGR